MNLIEAAKAEYERAISDQENSLATEGRQAMIGVLELRFGKEMASQARISTVEGTGQTHAFFEGMDSNTVLFIESNEFGHDGWLELRAMTLCPNCGDAQTSHPIKTLFELGQVLAGKRWFDHSCDGSLLEGAQHLRYIVFKSGDHDRAIAKANLWMAQNPKSEVIREHTTESIGDMWSSFTITLAYRPSVY